MKLKFFWKNSFVNYVIKNVQSILGLHPTVNTTLITNFVTLSFKAKTECIPLCVPRSSFPHKVTNSEKIVELVFNTSSLITEIYYKSIRTKQRNMTQCHMQMTGGPQA
jgi:hypothetical protein